MLFLHHAKRHLWEPWKFMYCQKYNTYYDHKMHLQKVEAFLLC